MNEKQQIQAMQNEINTLREQLNLASQAVAQANQAYQTLSSSDKILKPGKPEKFAGKNVRSWIKSIDNVFEAQVTGISDQQKIKYAVSYLSGDGLQWWELVTINGESVVSYEQFKQELLKHFEPINREHNARRVLSTLKQMGKFSTVRAYNQEFSKWLLQVPSMSSAEEVFHCSQGLKNRNRIEVERTEPSNLQDAMRIADRIDTLYQNGSGYGNLGFGSNSGSSTGPTPMEIGNVNNQRYNKLSYGEKQRCIENNLCFICKKPNCYARKHSNNQKFFNKDKRVRFRDDTHPSKTKTTAGWPRHVCGTMYSSRIS